MKFLFIIFVIGPAITFYSISYLLLNPDDWTGPAIIIPVGLIATVVSQYFGVKKYILQTAELSHP